MFYKAEFKEYPRDDSENHEKGNLYDLSENVNLLIFHISLIIEFSRIITEFSPKIVRHIYFKNYWIRYSLSWWLEILSLSCVKFLIISLSMFDPSLLFYFYYCGLKGFISFFSYIYNYHISEKATYKGIGGLFWLLQSIMLSRAIFLEMYTPWFDFYCCDKHLEHSILEMKRFISLYNSRSQSGGTLNLGMVSGVVQSMVTEEWGQTVCILSN